MGKPYQDFGNLKQRSTGRWVGGQKLFYDMGIQFLMIMLSSKEEILRLNLPILLD